MKSLTLVILAAGMGSRYGGLKQIDHFGANGEAIIDFSIFDAIAAGYTKLVLIIREEHQEVFEEVLVKKIRNFIDVEYAFQSLDDVPQWYSRHPERVKPWGTTHALLSAKDAVTGPFSIINADDYYGKKSYVEMARFLREEVSETTAAMMGYILNNTLTEHGTVTRGVSQGSKGYLQTIVETENISRTPQGVYGGDPLKIIPDDSLVSMNFWGFDSSIFALLQQEFEHFLQEEAPLNPLKSECFLPNVVGQLIRKNQLNVKVLQTTDRWFGVTYQNDKPYVLEQFKQFQSKGVYPPKLWEE